MFFKKKKNIITNNFPYRFLGIDSDTMLPIGAEPKKGCITYEEAVEKFSEEKAMAVWGEHAVRHIARLLYPVCTYQPNKYKKKDMDPNDETHTEKIKEFDAVFFNNLAGYTQVFLGYAWDEIDSITLDATMLYLYNELHGTNITLRTLMEAFFKNLEEPTLESLMKNLNSDYQLHQADPGHIQECNECIGDYNEVINWLLTQADYIWNDSYGFTMLVKHNGGSVEKMDVDKMTKEDILATYLMYLPRQRYTRRFVDQFKDEDKKYLLAQEFIKKQYDWEPGCDIEKYFSMV